MNGVSFIGPNIPFLSSEVEKLKPDLVGIFAIMVVKRVNNQDDAQFVYWGYGRLKDELTKARNNPCISGKVPTHFNYLEAPTDPLKRLKSLKEDFKPLCE